MICWIIFAYVYKFEECINLVNLFRALRAVAAGESARLD